MLDLLLPDDINRVRRQATPPQRPHAETRMDLLTARFQTHPVKINNAVRYARLQSFQFGLFGVERSVSIGAVVPQLAVSTNVPPDASLNSTARHGKSQSKDRAGGGVVWAAIAQLLLRTPEPGSPLDLGVLSRRQQRSSCCEGTSLVVHSNPRDTQLPWRIRDSQRW
jgi:hypothetical protein